jgi:hypothetical protein
MGINAQNAVYEGAGHHQTLVPGFKMPDTRDGSLSRSLAELEESQHITLEINEDPLAEQRSEQLTSRLNDAYGGGPEPEELEFLGLTREHFGRLDDE